MIQSSDYQPGQSGWKLHECGTLEINPKDVVIGGKSATDEGEVKSLGDIDFGAFAVRCPPRAEA